MSESCPSVCLLDDDPALLKGIGRLLVSAGITVQTFTDPGEFLAYAKVHRNPVAIIDVWMPQMNGLEVQLRLREISPSTRVIILTGKEDGLVRSTAMEAGASAFFLKPYDEEEFLTAVRMGLAGTDYTGFSPTMNGGSKDGEQNRRPSEETT